LKNANDKSKLRKDHIASQNQQISELKRKIHELSNKIAEDEKINYKELRNRDTEIKELKIIQLDLSNEVASKKRDLDNSNSTIQTHFNTLQGLIKDKSFLNKTICLLQKENEALLSILSLQVSVHPTNYQFLYSPSSKFI
jgi:chromosome segregation ATPase